MGLRYAGVGRQALLQCIAAFESEGKDAAIEEYRRIIGEADNFACVLTDLDSDNFTTEDHCLYFERIMSIMLGMCLLMNGNVK
jgi:hypothetical protein